MARAPVSKTGGCRFEVLPLLPGTGPALTTCRQDLRKRGGHDYIGTHR